MNGVEDELAALLAKVAGVDPADVYVTAVSGGSKNARNRARQAQDHHRLELLVLDDEETVEPSSEQVAHLVSRVIWS